MFLVKKDLVILVWNPHCIVKYVLQHTNSFSIHLSPQDVEKSAIFLPSLKMLPTFHIRLGVAFEGQAQ